MWTERVTNSWGSRSWEGVLPFHGYLQKLHHVLMLKSQEQSPYGSGRGKGGANIVKYAQNIFHNKGYSPGEKTLPESIPPGIKEEHFSHSSPFNFLSHSRVEEERTKKYL